MSCKILAICDSENSYADLLTKQLLRIPGNRLEIRNFTDIEKVKEFTKENKLTYLLLAEAYSNEIENIDSLAYYFLTEQKEKTNIVKKDMGIVQYIYRFQPAQEIYQIICSNGKENSKQKNSKINIAKVETKFIAVYHPVHRNGTSTVAKALSRMKGEKEKVLYINLEEYPGPLAKELEEGAVELGEGNLGDLLYYCKQNQDMAENRIKTVVHRLKQYNAIAPIPVSEELRDVLWSEWESLLEVLRKSNYHTIIFDIHSCMQGHLNFLEQCDIIYVPEIIRRNVRDKYEYFENEMRLLGRNEVLIKMESLSIPEFMSNIDVKVEDKIRSLIGGV